jgi:hypothetical protein
MGTSRVRSGRRLKARRRRARRTPMARPILDLPTRILALLPVLPAFVVRPVGADGGPLEKMPTLGRRWGGELASSAHRGRLAWPGRGAVLGAFPGEGGPLRSAGRGCGGRGASVVSDLRDTGSGCRPGTAGDPIRPTKPTEGVRKPDGCPTGPARSADGHGACAVPRHERPPPSPAPRRGPQRGRRVVGARWHRLADARRDRRLPDRLTAPAVSRSGHPAAGRSAYHHRWSSAASVAAVDLIAANATDA